MSSPAPSSGAAQPALTKFERVKVIGLRAEQLVRGSQPLVPVEAGAPFDPYAVAERELRSRRLPFNVVRTLPDGSTELVKLE